MISGIEVKVDGAPLDATLAERVTEVRVEHHFELPDSFCVRISDPGLEQMDKSPFKLGAEVEIRFTSPDGGTLTPLIAGQVLAVEPDFSVGHMILAARGYDHAHALQRTGNAETYQNMTIGDIVKKVAQRAGFQVGEIEDGGGGVLDFIQQSQETDWDFLWRLARRIDCKVVVEKKTLHFRKLGGQGRDGRAQVGGGPDGLPAARDRCPAGGRGRRAQLERADEGRDRGHRQGRGRHEQDRHRPRQGAQGARRRPRDGQRPAGLHARRGHRPGQERARAARQRLSRGRGLDARGSATARRHARLDRRGRASASKAATRSRPPRTSSKARAGYQTQFTISGRSPRTLVELTTPSPPRSFGNSVVVGIVTQNDDPDKMGRVRVKYPDLGDQIEGWWARLAAPGAGKDRGLLMLPLVGDEVLVAFEHGDAQRPYVLGSLWNAQDQPGDLAHTDGSYALHTEQQIVMDADKAISIKGKDTLTLESKGDMTITTDGSLKESATRELSISGQTIKIDSSSTLSIKATSITIEGAMVEVKGMVQLG